MITQRSFDIAANIEEGTEQITIDVRADARIFIGTVVVALDGEVYRLSASDAGRLGTILIEMGQAAHHLARIQDPHRPPGDYDFRRVEGDTIPDLSDELPRKRVRDQRIA